MARAARARAARLHEGVGGAVGNQYGGVRRRRGRCGKGKRDSQRKTFLGPKRQYRKHTRTRATSTQRAKSGWRSARTAARARAPPRPTNHLRRDSACGHRPIRPQQRDAGSDASLTRARRAARTWPNHALITGRSDVGGMAWPTSGKLRMQLAPAAPCPACIGAVPGTTCLQADDFLDHVCLPALTRRTAQPDESWAGRRRGL